MITSSYLINKNHANNIIRNIDELIYDDIYIYNAQGDLLASNTSITEEEVVALGKKVAQHKSILVSDVADKKYKAIINPVFIGGTLVAIIGLVGDYVRITQYSELVVKIVEILLSESKYYVEKIKRAEEKRLLLRFLMENDQFELARLTRQSSSDFKASRTKFVILLEMDNLQLETAVTSIEKRIPHSVLVTDHMGKVVILSEESNIKNLVYDLSKVIKVLKDKTDMTIIGGISNPLMSLSDISNAYYQAEKTISFCKDQYGEGLYAFGEEAIGLIFDGVEKPLAYQLVKEVFHACSDKEIREIDALIRLYMDHNSSLKETSDAMFIHKNTLQYRLNRIEQITGCNPRHTKDLYKLYTALNLYKVHVQKG